MADQHPPESLGFREGAVYQCLKEAGRRVALGYVVERVYGRTLKDPSYTAAWCEAFDAVARLAAYGLVEHSGNDAIGVEVWVKPGAVVFEVWAGLSALEVGILTYLRAEGGSPELNEIAESVAGCPPSDPGFPGWVWLVLDSVRHLQSLGVVWYWYRDEGGQLPCFVRLSDGAVPHG